MMISLGVSSQGVGRDHNFGGFPGENPIIWWDIEVGDEPD
jgi:hypothetical protein